MVKFSELRIRATFRIPGYETVYYKSEKHSYRLAIETIGWTTSFSAEDDMEIELAQSAHDPHLTGQLSRLSFFFARSHTLPANTIDPCATSLPNNIYFSYTANIALFGIAVAQRKSFLVEKHSAKIPFLGFCKLLILKVLTDAIFQGILGCGFFVILLQTKGLGKMRKSIVGQRRAMSCKPQTALGLRLFLNYFRGIKIALRQFGMLFALLAENHTLRYNR